MFKLKNMNKCQRNSNLNRNLLKTENTQKQKFQKKKKKKIPLKKLNYRKPVSREY